jgi:integrase
MEAKKLTKKVVDGLQAAEREYSLHDTELKGFHVRVFPSGEKTYALRYKLRGATRRIAIGSTTIFTAEQARTQAMALKQRVREGRDPAQERRDDSQAETVGGLWVRYLRDHALPHKKPRSVEEDQRLWSLHLEQRFSRKLVRDLRREEVQRMVSDMVATPGAANRTVALLSKMMSLAVQWEIASQNPCVGVRKYAEHSREPQPLPQASLQALLVAIEQEATEGDAGGALAVLLILLTGARRGEAIAARWSQFELLPDGRLVWSLAATSTKQRRANRKPLGPALSSQLLEWRDVTGGCGDSLVFPSQRVPDQPRADLKGVWNRIRERAALSGVRVHDLRHDWITAAVSAGVPLEVAGKYAGHSNTATTRRYAHIQDDPLRRAAELREAALLGARLAPEGSL